MDGHTLPTDIAAALSQLDEELAEGDITTKGYLKRRTQLFAATGLSTYLDYENREISGPTAPVARASQKASTEHVNDYQEHPSLTDHAGDFRRSEDNISSPYAPSSSSEDFGGLYPESAQTIHQHMDFTDHRPSSGDSLEYLRNLKLENSDRPNHLNELDKFSSQFDHVGPRMSEEDPRFVEDMQETEPSSTMAQERYSALYAESPKLFEDRAETWPPTNVHHQNAEDYIQRKSSTQEVQLLPLEPRGLPFAIQDSRKCLHN